MEVTNSFSHYPNQLTSFLFFACQPLQWDWSRRSRLPVERWERGKGQSSWRRSMWTPRVSRASLSSKACSPTLRYSPSARFASSWLSRWWVLIVSCLLIVPPSLFSLSLSLFDPPSLSLSAALSLFFSLSGYRIIQESSLDVSSHLVFLSQL